MPTSGSSTAPGLARLLNGLAGFGAVGATRNVREQLVAERDAVAAAEARLARFERTPLEHARPQRAA